MEEENKTTSPEAGGNTSGAESKMTEEVRVKPHKIRWWHYPLLLFLIVGTFYVSKNSKESGAQSQDRIGEAWADTQVQRSEGNIFGTVYHITYASETDYQNGIDSVLKVVDNSLSPFNPNSTITKINDNTCLDTDAHFLKVYTIARRVSEMTDGAFDITVAPLVNAWGFGFKNMDKVTDRQVDSLCQFVGYEKISVEDGAVHKSDKRIMLDCSAVAKGYGVDAVAEYLQSKGVANYMVEIGGEVRVLGFNPSGANWKIGILKPEDDSLGINNDIEEILKLSDISVATSGNYRNYYEKGSKKYAHTIDPRTGRPVQHTILSSTVVARTCALADAYATAFMVLGIEDAKKVLEKEKDISAYFIYSVGGDKTAEWCSDDIKEKLIDPEQ